MKLLLVVTSAALLTACGGVVSPSPTVTVYEDSASTRQSSLEQDLLGLAWDSLSYTDQRDVCAFYNEDPAGAWIAFSGGDEELVSPQEFRVFFNSVC